MRLGSIRSGVRFEAFAGSSLTGLTCRVAAPGSFNGLFTGR
jgi:hypothetical protein